MSFNCFNFDAVNLLCMHVCAHSHTFNTNLDSIEAVAARFTNSNIVHFQ